MKKAIVATKVGMTQIFNEDGVLTPVTVLQAGPVYVSQIKTVENDGYEAVQVAFGDVREKLVNKPEKGHLAKAGIENKRFLTEFKFENAAEYELGQEIKADIFEAGDKIDVTSHKFDNTCDTSCNDCDYTRTISHKYISKYDSVCTISV